MNIDTSLIPPYEGEYKTIKKNGSTKDIIDSINRQISKYNDPRFCEFSKQFGDGMDGLKRLWNFVRYQIKYEKDTFETSHQMSPPALWHLGKGDCKSKTIFIACVLKSLGIPFVIRYTNYDKREKEVKHVYLVAILDNSKKIPIDSVYYWFGQEKAYNKKIDVPMAKIVEINGIKGADRDSSMANTSQVSTVTRRRIARPTASNCKTVLKTTDRAIKLETIRQKKEYVKPPEPIEFSKISEAVASLKIAKRQLEIIKVMRPELSSLCDKGINMLYKAEKGNFCNTGDIPSELNRVAAKIKRAERLQMYKANGFGLPGVRRREAELYSNKKSTSHINGYPERLCLNGLFKQERVVQDPQPPHNVYAVPFDYMTFNEDVFRHNGGSCMSGGWDASYEEPWRNAPVQYQVYASGGSIGANTPLLWDQLYYVYGSDSKYRSSFREMKDSFDAAISNLAQDGIISNVGTGATNGSYSVYLSSPADYNLMIDELNNSSGVLDKYVNDIFAADSSTIDGTIGSGLFYTFADGMSFNNVPINLNDLPGTVLSKRGFQDQFLDATNVFSGLSRSNVKELARNGVLFDNEGVQPESTLNGLQAIYEGRANIPGINCPPCPIIAAIAALVVAVIGAVAAAVAKTTAAETQAALIDQSGADVARFSPLGASLMVEQDDFTPGSFKKTGSGGSNSGLLLGAAALAAAAMWGSSKEKK
jgi:hypothetical protein